MKQSYNNENLHNELILKIKEFIDSMEEFETTPFYQTEEGYQKSFGVLSDNGNFNVMKRFTITVEDHKLENKISEKKEMEVKQKCYTKNDVESILHKCCEDLENNPRGFWNIDGLVNEIVSTFKSE